MNSGLEIKNCNLGQSFNASKFKMEQSLNEDKNKGKDILFELIKVLFVTVYLFLSTFLSGILLNLPGRKLQFYLSLSLKVTRIVNPQHRCFIYKS